MNFSGIEPFSLMEYPGEVACILFTRGCNLRCGYCHNPELVLPERFQNQDVLSERSVLDFLEKRRGLLDAVSICGGEPTLQPDLLHFIATLKDMGFKVKLDTNGLQPKVVEYVLAYNMVDYIAMDIKMPISEYTIVSPMKANIMNLRESIMRISAASIMYEFRTTIVEAIHTKDVIIKMAKELSGVKKWVLQGFRTGKVLDNRYETYPSTSHAYLQQLQQDVMSIVPNVEIRF